MTDTAVRFVRTRCPICQETSPVVDQATDVRRVAMSDWWHKHKLTHLPHPIIEATEPEGRCVATLGERPSWMSPDQYDPCRCVHPMGHEGEHGCEHTGATSDIATIDAPAWPPFGANGPEVSSDHQ